MPSDRPLLLQFLVKDYGKGINQKDFKNIFEPFHQGKPGAHFMLKAEAVGVEKTISSFFWYFQGLLPGCLL